MSDNRHRQVRSVVHNAIREYELVSRLKLRRRLCAKNESRIAKLVQETGHHKQLLEIAQKREYYTNKLLDLLEAAGAETDAQAIDNRDDAEWFIRRRFARTPEAAQVKVMIKKHERFQESAAEQHKQILLRYGLAKFAADKDRALAAFFAEQAAMQRKYAEESVDLLRQAKVPFFCEMSSSGDREAALLEDQVFVLDLLQRVLA